MSLNEKITEMPDEEHRSVAGQNRSSLEKRRRELMFDQKVALAKSDVGLGCVVQVTDS